MDERTSRSSILVVIFLERPQARQEVFGGIVRLPTAPPGATTPYDTEEKLFMIR